MEQSRIRTQKGSRDDTRGKPARIDIIFDATILGML